MRDSERGPYSRIRWFCNDGTVQPPVAYACREHGGGRQHAEYSPARARLAELGWSVGTIYAALTQDELLQSRPREGRLRELPLEQYLVDIDGGWVLARARDYRGRIQVEDESYAGHELLTQLVSRDSWALDNFLLVRELARTIPHGSDSDLARSVRREAIELAELEPAAERWRVEIHTNPSRDIAPRLAAWAAGHENEEVAGLASRLAADLDLLYGPTGRRARIDASLRAVGRGEAGAAWRRAVGDALALDGPDLVAQSCGLLATARADLFGQLRPASRVALLDAMTELDATVQIAFQESLATAALTRAELLRLGGSLADCAFGSGLLSEREREAVHAVTAPDNSGRPIGLDEYRRAISMLKRVPGWALGAARHAFAEALIAYTALDARAARFSDDLLRGSPLWMFGDVLRRLSRDADGLAGSRTEIGEDNAGTGVALNPGVARGTLRIFETIESVEDGDLKPGDIVALPETIAELSPVAGILTLGEGNALSHVQLLARNFGIPNVAVDFETIDSLRSLEGRDVLLVAGSNGDVILRAVDDELRAVLDAGTAQPARDATGIEVPVPELDVDRVLALAEIGREMSGRIVGPKAANLGELNRLFPGRVAPAVAIPFGIYAGHLHDAGLDTRIAAAFGRRARGEISAADADAELASIRSEIAALTLDDRVRGELDAIMAREFGEPGNYGVFVRSDTNVEDLPQFTGAGLNETVPNVVGFDAQLAAVPRVWSSVLSPRALAWRSSVLADPSRIYASVLLMMSVPSTKSGVLVTRNVADRKRPGLTVSAAWGVGGAVAGEAAETLVIFPDGTELVSEAKSPWRRHVAASGGVDWLPAPSGAVLEAAEIDALRGLAAEVGEKYAPVFADDGSQRPWDIEFGFVDGELTLFQIRPLVERGGRNADRMLEQLLPPHDGEPASTLTVDLDAVPGG